MKLHNLVVGISAGIALGLGFSATFNTFGTTSYAAKATYRKNGHTWYKAKNKSYDAEVMPGVYKYNVDTGKNNIPKNKTKHIKLYTVSNIPVLPSNYKNTNVPVSIGGWDSLVNSADQQSVDYKKQQRKLPKQLRGHNFIWFNVQKNVYLRVNGSPYVYPKKTESLGTYSGTLYHVYYDDYSGIDVVLPNGVKPTDKDAAPLSFSLPTGKGLSKASRIYYFGGELNKNGMTISNNNHGQIGFDYDDYTDGRPTLAIPHHQGKNIKVVLEANDAYLDPLTAGTYTYKLKYDTDNFQSDHPVKSLHQTVKIKIKEDPKRYTLSQQQVDNLQPNIY